MENIKSLLARLKADVIVRKYAEDGGPGSGNWGHAGRPGKVGGSARGKGSGGKQYRGGRSDIGYFSSKRDWLNGLQGYRQQEAANKLKNAKQNLQHFLSYKDRLIGEWEKGHFGVTELQRRLEEKGLDKVYKGMPAEEFVMKMGNAENKKELLKYIGEARSWNDLAMRQQIANLSNEEQKYLGMVCLDYNDKHKENEDSLTLQEFQNYNLDRVFDKLTPEQQEFYLDMKAKACGIENSGKPLDDYSDEFLVSIGAKEPQKKRQTGGDWFGWMDSKELPTPIYHNSRANLLFAAGEKTGDKDKIKDNNDRFAMWKKVLNEAKHENTFTQGRAEAAARFMRQATLTNKEDWEKAVREAMTSGKLMNLDEQETKRFLAILLSAKAGDMKSDEIGRLEMSVVDNLDRIELIDYFTLKSKAISGIEPDATEVYNEKKELAKKEKAAKTKAFIDGLDSWEKKLSEAKTTSDVSSILSNSGIFSTGTNIKLERSSRLASIEIAKSYGQVIKKFPFLYGEMSDLDENEFGKDTYACCHFHSNRGISINASPTYFGDKGNLDGQYDDNVKSGFHPKGTASNSIITHEIGHALDAWLSRRKVIGSQMSSYDTHCFSGMLRRRVLKSLKMTKAMVATELSKYAEKDALEWFAEAFAEAMHSPEPRPMAKEMMRQLNEILVEEGLLDE